MKSIEQYYLGKLAEECAEVSQIALKTDIFGMLEKQPNNLLNNRQRIHAELNDLLAVIEVLNENHNLGFTPDQVAISEKKEKMHHYLKYSQRLGRVSDDCLQLVSDKDIEGLPF